MEGEGAGEKELLGFKIFIWVASFSEGSAPWNSFLSWGLGGRGHPSVERAGVGSEGCPCKHRKEVHVCVCVWGGRI